jgi:hypothetical protein
MLQHSVLEQISETTLQLVYASRLLWLVSLHTLNATEPSLVLLANAQLSPQTAVLVTQFLVLVARWNANPTNIVTQMLLFV